MGNFFFGVRARVLDTIFPPLRSVKTTRTDGSSSTGKPFHA